MHKTKFIYKAFYDLEQIHLAICPSSLFHTGGAPSIYMKTQLKIMHVNIFFSQINFEEKISMSQTFLLVILENLHLSESEKKRKYAYKVKFAYMSK